MSSLLTIPHPYPAYRPYGVPWLGDVPAHWEVLPGRASYSSSQMPNKGLLETTVLSLSYGQIKIRPEENLHGLVPASFETYQIVEPDDIICRPTDLQNDWNSLRFGLSKNRGIITSAYIRLRTRPLLRADYGYLLLHTYDLKKVFYGLGSGLRQNLAWADFKLLPCLVPPLPEQRAIVRYLYYEDRRIRRYVVAKRRLIALLEEEKQAIINRAVTRGLDPSVRLKASGVEWLGDVPEHWEMVGLKFLSKRIQNGSTPPTIQPRYYEDGTIPWYGPSSCKSRGEVGAPVRYLTQDAFSVGAARMIHEPALLIVVIGATAGRMALLEEKGSTNQQITSFELNSNLVHPVFVLEQAGCAEHWLRATASTATIPILDAAVVSSLSVAVPPIEEQSGIVGYLNNTIPTIDTAIALARRQIELVQEYLTRLIADVVTGKLDVRAAAAELPDEEEPIDGDGLVLDNMADGSSDVMQLLEEEQAMESEVTA